MKSDVGIPVFECAPCFGYPPVLAQDDQNVFATSSISPPPIEIFCNIRSPHVQRFKYQLKIIISYNPGQLKWKVSTLDP